MVNKYNKELMIYYIIVFIISAALTFLCDRYGVELIQSTADIAISTVTTGSFGALFFLMALPRTGFLQKIEDNGTLFYYSIIIGMPALTGSTQLTFASISVKSKLKLMLFFGTILSFMLSILFIYLIMRRHSNTQLNIGRRSIKSLKQ